MSFGQDYINKFLFNREEDWTTESILDWIHSNGYQVGSGTLQVVRAFRGSQAGTILMLYTPISADETTLLSGYYVTNRKATESYVPEGWEFVSPFPEEILI